MLYKFNKAASEKKEIVLLVIILLLFGFGVFFKHSRISSLSKDSNLVHKEFDELTQIVRRDTLIQNEIMPIKKLYDTNRRGDENFENLNVALLKKIEGLLRNLKITYDSNNLKQERSEIKENGMSFFYIDLSFKAKSVKVMKLLLKLESDKSDIFDIMKLKISKVNNFDANQFDGFVADGKNRGNKSPIANKLLSVELKLRVVKFL